MSQKPLPVKLFCGLIGRDEALASAREQLEREFGPVDLETDAGPFDFTGYYEEEMGSDLIRKWISFAELKERAYLARAKSLSVSIESALARDGSRTVNIDPGYVDNAQVVLSTAKNFAHRIYIGAGFYAEVTLIYSGKSFRPVEWTYPDYRSRQALEFFGKMRASYHTELRKRGER
jgi:hypothetical protein